jgi:predicted amidohydrolase YtcJ
MPIFSKSNASIEMDTQGKGVRLRTREQGSGQTALVLLPYWGGSLMKPDRAVRRMFSTLLTILVLSGATVAQTSQQTSKPTADFVIRAGAIHTMAQGRPTMHSIAIGGGKVLAVDEGPHDLDAFIGPSTQVIDDPTLTLLPGFIDTHTHLIFAASDINDVHVNEAKDIAGFLDLIRKRAAATPKGTWIRTASDWNEWNLAEKRMPQASDLDKATSDHPVLVRRGGHNDVLNTMGMRMVGLTRDTPTPHGGVIVKDSAGNPTGWLIDSAKGMAERAFPPPTKEQRIEELRLASLDYAANGITTVRDAFVQEDELALYQAAREGGVLNVRVRAMVGFGFGPGTPSQMTPWMDRVAARIPSGDDMFRIWGLKLVLDGGAENGATQEPYVGRPDFRGELFWQEDTLAEVISNAVRRGLKVGVHAWGDRAVHTLLDVYERVLKENPGVPKGALVLEHGGLSPTKERARAAKMGIPVTVQHPLLHDLAFGLIQGWGTERTADVFPVREWLQEGALVGAGSDYPVGEYDAMMSVWGMVTRQTRAGVLGAEHAIDVATAIRLYTVDAARLIAESDRLGTLQPGRLADVVAYRRDPMSIPVDELRALRPAFTMFGGRIIAHQGKNPVPSSQSK